MELKNLPKKGYFGEYGGQYIPEELNRLSPRSNGSMKKPKMTRNLSKSITTY
jgi:tryptophan synthase beta subunit